MGAEKQTNAALQPMTEDAFVDFLLADQPFVPLYFPFDVELNKKGAPFYKESIGAVPHLTPDTVLAKNTLVLDTRPAAAFRKCHLPGSINLHDGLKFETWLGTIISPKESFYMITANKEARELLISKTAKIGYEQNIAGVLVKLPAITAETSPELDVADFKNNPESYTVIDIRNRREVQEKPIFPKSLNLPLPELRQLLDNIPTNKPIMVHCAGGYRSAIGSSIIAAHIKNQPVYDLGEVIQTFS
jgi:rhodanese-related sulfurtransferase